MPKLSIITINFNNSEGLRRTMESVFNQTSTDLEYIVVDGASIDDSVAIIKGFENHLVEQFNDSPVQRFTWISEPDSGIYNAMNKGIRMAKGDYCQFLNSGDILASDDVTEIMLKDMQECDILYGNMLKPFRRRIIQDRGFAGRIPSMFDFYTGTLNHSPAYIKRNLFDNYGFYDEKLKIVSDWKWYLQVIALNNVVPVYKDIDVTVFDMNGVSTVNSELDKAERRKVIEDLLPLTVLCDYDQYTFPINQLKRINRYWLTRNGFYLLERTLFKWEKLFKTITN